MRLIPSGFLGLMASVRGLGVDVHLYNPSPDVREVLETTNLNRLMPIHEIDFSCGGTAGMSVADGGLKTASAEGCGMDHVRWQRVVELCEELTSRDLLPALSCALSAAIDVSSRWPSAGVDWRIRRPTVNRTIGSSSRR